MENAADALQMAAAVLIFVLALSISINAFGEARATSQILLDYNDREYDYTYVENNESTERILSAETIVPAIYRAYKENYKIVFKGITLYQKNGQVVSYIDLEKETLGNENQKEAFIEWILYGGTTPEFLKNIGITEPNGTDTHPGIYSTISGSTFKESLGVYYQEELSGGSNSPDANKTIKRVITYEKQ